MGDALVFGILLWVEACKDKYWLPGGEITESRRDGLIVPAC